MHFRLGRKKNNEKKTVGLDSSRPPPAPSLSKVDTMIPIIRREQDSGKRCVQFRDNRLPDGRQTCSTIPRPRLSIFDQSQQNHNGDRSSPTASIISSSSKAVFQSFSSYPASYMPDKYQDYTGNSTGSNWYSPTRKHSDTYDNRSYSSKDYGRITRDFNMTKVAGNVYDADIPKPDYPLSFDCVKNINRDSGLDTDSRSSSGLKTNTVDQHYNKQSVAYHTTSEFDFGDGYVNYSAMKQNTGHQMNKYFMTLPPSRNEYNFSDTKPLQEEPKFPYDRNARMLKTSSLNNIPRKLYDDICFSNSGVCGDSHENHSRNTNRIQDSLQCLSCSCCHDIRDEIGRFSSVGTNTDTQRMEQEDSCSSNRTPSNNHHPPSMKKLNIISPLQKLEWESIGDSEDFVYRPKLPFQKHEIDIRKEYHPTEQMTSYQKKLPRCEPMKSSNEKMLNSQLTSRMDSELETEIIRESTSDYHRVESPTSNEVLMQFKNNENSRPSINSSFIQL